ncbi:hypothetical protein K438DRAFT_1769472 [Mycena galopus ATCC 62051]|nr:hypothetical protein K438DRAFT_1769472 [Mycena galopus ATCC 62051]
MSFRAPSLPTPPPSLLHHHHTSVCDARPNAMKHGLQLLLWTLPVPHSETWIKSSNWPFKKYQVDTDTISMTRMPILRHLRPRVHLPLMLFSGNENVESASGCSSMGREEQEQQECVQREREERECRKREQEEHEREERERQEQEEREHREREC